MNVFIPRCHRLKKSPFTISMNIGKLLIIWLSLIQIPFISKLCKALTVVSVNGAAAERRAFDLCKHRRFLS